MEVRGTREKEEIFSTSGSQDINVDSGSIRRNCIPRVLVEGSQTQQFHSFLWSDAQPNCEIEVIIYLFILRSWRDKWGNDGVGLLHDFAVRCLLSSHGIVRTVPLQRS